VEHWHAWIGDATIAGAILDRLLSRSHRLNLKRKSMRAGKADTTNSSTEINKESIGTDTPKNTAAE
jgi:hypothetical protein